MVVRLSLLALLFLIAGTASAQRPETSPTAPFDGDWKVTLSCPPTDVAKGYSHRFTAQVRNSHLRAVYGKTGEPGWQELEGDIAADGTARLAARGIVGDTDYAARSAPRGESFAYGVDARFDGSSGTGERTTVRRCSFRFTR